MANAITAEQYFLKYAESGKDFVLDFSKVDFITSAGIRALLTLYRTVAEKEGSVTIKNPQPQVMEVLSETEFAELFSIKFGARSYYGGNCFVRRKHDDSGSAYYGSVVFTFGALS